jgi:hypothetical protein
LLDRGDLNGAHDTFEECLARARQLEVAELVARSYEDQMRVAEKRADHPAARSYSQKAQAARSGL